MKIQSKITTLFLILFLISIIFLSLITFSNFKNHITSQIYSELSIASKNTENSINLFLEGQMNKLKLIATQSELSTEEFKELISRDNSFYDFFIINSSGIVTVSSNPDRLGLYRGDRDYFVNAKNTTHLSSVYFALVPKQYSISVFTPFHGSVLVGAMTLEAINQLAIDSFSYGSSGENLIAFINDEGKVVYFTDRKFSDNKGQEVSFEETPIFMQNALKNNAKTLLGIKDYRGVNVLAISNYLEKTKMGLVTKADEIEIFAPIVRLQGLLIFVITIILLLVAFFIYVLAKSIVGELNILSRDIGLITKGNLDIQLKKSNIFEIQSLTDSLNRILASLKLAILRIGALPGDIGIGEIIKSKKETEEKYKLLYETSGDAIMIIEPPTWNFTAGNSATLKMFNLTDEKQLASLNAGELSPKYQPDGQLSSVKAKKMIEKAMKEGSAFFEWTHKRYGDGEFAATVLLSKIKEGNKTYLQATVRDISLSKTNEETLKAIVDNSQVGIAIYGTDYKLKMCNPFFCKTLGYSEEELKNLTFAQITYPEDIAASLENVKKLQAGKIEFFSMNKRYIRKDKKIIYASVHVSTIKTGKDITYFVISFEDITEQKQMNDKYQTLFDNASDAIFIHDLEGHFLEINEIACKRLGYTRAELLKLGPSKIDSPRFAKFVPKRIKELKEKGHAIFETVHITKKGKEIPIELSSKVIEYNGKPAILSIARDISERKLEEAKFRETIDNMDNGVAIYTVEGEGKNFIFVDFNKKAEKLDKIKKETLIGKRVTEVFSGVKKSGIFDKFYQVWKTGKSVKWSTNVYEDKRLGRTPRENYVYKLPTGEIVAVYREVSI